jgi:hypothetical protein
LILPKQNTPLSNSKKKCAAISMHTKEKKNHHDKNEVYNQYLHQNPYRNHFKLSTSVSENALSWQRKTLMLINLSSNNNNSMVKNSLRAANSSTASH